MVVTYTSKGLGQHFTSTTAELTNTEGQCLGI